MKEQDKVEQIFQESFNNFEVKPDASVWSGIESNLSASTVGATSIAGKIVIGLVVASGIAVSAYFITDREHEQVKVEEVRTEEVESLNADGKENSSILTDTSIGYEEAISPVVEERNDTQLEKAAKESPKSSPNKVEVSTKKNTPATVNNSSTVSPARDAHSASNEANEPSGLQSESNKSGQKKVDTKKVEAATSNENSQTSKQNSSEKDESKAEPSSTSTRELGSETTESTEISAVIPNIFTPNGDGLNDVFRIEVEDATSIEASIVDKQGRIVFEWNGLYGFWDGNLPNGKAADVGTYFYRILLIKDELKTPRTGSFRLER